MTSDNTEAFPGENFIKTWFDKWVEALRSKKYKQGRGSLVQETEDGDYKYCCMGVLLKIAGYEVLHSVNPSNPKETYSRLVSPSGETYCTMPGLHCGLSNLNQATLATLNDASVKIKGEFEPRTKTFYEIADILEKNKENVLTYETIQVPEVC